MPPSHFAEQAEKPHQLLHSQQVGILSPHSRVSSNSPSQPFWHPSKPSGQEHSRLRDSVASPPHSQPDHSDHSPSSQTACSAVQSSSSRSGAPSQPGQSELSPQRQVRERDRVPQPPHGHSESFSGHWENSVQSDQQLAGVVNRGFGVVRGEEGFLISFYK